MAIATPLFDILWQKQKYTTSTLCLLHPFSFHVLTISMQLPEIGLESMLNWWWSTRSSGGEAKRIIDTPYSSMYLSAAKGITNIYARTYLNNKECARHPDSLRCCTGTSIITNLLIEVNDMYHYYIHTKKVGQCQWIYELMRKCLSAIVNSCVDH